MTILLQKTPVVSPRRPKTTLILNNEKICAKKPSMLATVSNQRSMVIVVLSARNNFMKRKLARQTYGSIKSVNNINILGLIFMLGSLDAPRNEKVDFNKLEEENFLFGDMIMGEFVDTYRNLTRKTIMAYEWLTSFCQEAQIVVKTDDDVLLNIFKLTEEVSKWSPNEFRSSNIWCTVHWTEGVVKDVNSVFYASPVDFPDGVFPKHCAGVGYITPMRVIERIAEEISTSFLGRVCTHEDVFMTAIVPHKINSNLNLEKRLPNESIELINSRDDWYTYALETEKGDEAEFLLKLLQESSNDTNNADKLLEQFEPKMFYLLTHNQWFEKRYTRLWEMMEKKSKKPK